ncbi:cyclophilinty pepeptidyl-prolylcis-transisomerase/CLD [Ordospora pajunii]|uniref:cyclophilinty pepeptidyl-prolylcis-transisomerase/CLD n=1 Tax=Ordospora pajunii TaxID=3039483 RepID=UPI002952628C|nr:cyclophilinty pepeptidyl-prolylcis-transisomerase/CLD [Ordospora pajunii]KAH9410985.1 cyclophilinty pepeptidyl-prolylcis-transisomerase/CLD [Ordospora pajunii]
MSINVFFEVSEVKGSTKNIIGKIVMSLDDATVPETAKNFRELCKRPEGSGYLMSTFHRIIPGFMIQGGDYTAHDGTGGRSIFPTNTFADENFQIKHTGEGLLSMANCGKNTNGSQFFITLAKTPWLDGKHVVFGKVVEGMSVVHNIAKYGTESGKVKDGYKIQISACGEVPNN